VFNERQWHAGQKMTKISTAQVQGCTARIRAGFAVFMACALLGACGSVPPAPASVVQAGVTPAETPAGTSAAIRAGPADPGGPIRLSAASVWLPSASGFAATGVAQKRDGRVVFTDNSVSWQYRSPGGLYRTAHRVAFADIRSVALAESGVDRLIVLQKQDFRYDAFGVMRPDEKAVDPLATMEAYRTLLELLHLPAPVTTGDKAF
jgi:hypothetical protein